MHAREKILNFKIAISSTWFMQFIKKIEDKTNIVKAA